MDPVHPSAKGSNTDRVRLNTIKKYKGPHLREALHVFRKSIQPQWCETPPPDECPAEGEADEWPIDGDAIEPRPAPSAP